MKLIVNDNQHVTRLAKNLTDEDVAYTVIFQYDPSCIDVVSALKVVRAKNWVRLSAYLMKLAVMPEVVGEKIASSVKQRLNQQHTERQRQADNDIHQRINEYRAKSAQSVQFALPVASTSIEGCGLPSKATITATAYKENINTNTQKDKTMSLSNNELAVPTRFKPDTEVHSSINANKKNIEESHQCSIA